MPSWKNTLFHQVYELKNPLFVPLLICDVVLRGISQVYLCDHPVTGALILAGLMCTSPHLVAHALLGVIASTLSCIYFTAPPMEEVFAGLCGFDGALVGCACWAFMGPKSSYGCAFFMSAFAGIVRTGLKHLLGLAELPGFTAAFNVVMVLLLSADHIGLFGFSVVLSSSTYPEDFTKMSAGFFWDATIRGVGQFIFADTTVGGIFVILGIAIASRRAAFALVLGSFVGFIGTYYFLAVPESQHGAIRSGLYGYNCAGTCAVIAGGVFFGQTPKTVVLGIVASLWCVLLTAGFVGFLSPFPVLTIPFIMSAWLMMLCCRTSLEEETDREIFSVELDSDISPLWNEAPSSDSISETSL